MIVTIYSLTTGRALRVLDAPAHEVAMNFDAATEAVHVGAVDVDATWFQVGVPKPLPPRPGEWAVWDGAEWVDMRTDENLAAALEQARDMASLSKVEFVMSCMEVGLLSPPEAIAAARGEIPESFAPVVESLSPMQRDYACVYWAAARQINRTDPFIADVAAAAGISDDTLDDLFQVQRA